MPTTIHPLAAVNPKATLGNDVTIGPFVTIDADVVIGDHTIIDSGAVIRDGARIGNHCHVYTSAVIGEIPQDLKFKGETTTAVVGDYTSIREFVTVHRGTASKGVTRIGSHCLIMAYCHVAHDCAVGDHVIMSNSAQIAGEVVVGDWAVLGGGALIHQFTRIGQHSMLQGGALVNKDIPPYSMAGRYPISYEGVNSVGLHRRGFSDEQINSIQATYRTLYLSGLNISDALNKVSNEVPASPERDTIIEFVRASKRGVIRLGI